MSQLSRVTPAEPARGAGSAAGRDLAAVAAVAAVAYLLAIRFDAFEHLARWIEQHDDWQADELVTLALVLVVAVAIFAWRRWQELRQEIRRRRTLEAEQAALIEQLQAALADIHVLRGLLPICAACKRVRDDQGYWQDLEAYVARHAGVQISHAICPPCAQRLYPELMPRVQAHLDATARDGGPPAPADRAAPSQRPPGRPLGGHL